MTRGNDFSFSILLCFDRVFGTNQISKWNIGTQTADCNLGFTHLSGVVIIVKPVRDSVFDHHQIQLTVVNLCPSVCLSVCLSRHERLSVSLPWSLL